MLQKRERKHSEQIRRSCLNPEARTNTALEKASDISLRAEPSEAINAFVRATERGALAERARAILQVAYERRALGRLPAPVLAEVCRGPHFDATIDRLLNGRGIQVLTLTRGIAQRAGCCSRERSFPLRVQSMPSS